MSNHGNGVHRQYLNTSTIILGILLGGVLTAYWGWVFFTHQHIAHSPIEETLLTAVYLTFLVGYIQFKYPTFVPGKPLFALFLLSVLAGHVSLFFDSFAVILLFNTLSFVALEATRSVRFNAFVNKVVASLNALTVGGAFYLGELWALAYYIASGYDFPTAGFPLLVVLTPYCLLASGIAAWKFPVKVEHVPFDREQRVKAVEFTVGLVLLIWTHSPFLCLGVLLLYSGLHGHTQKLLENGLHELKEGAMVALGLIGVAWGAQLLLGIWPGSKEVVANFLNGPAILFFSALSSPLTGAMLSPAESLQEFYTNLSWVMLGAVMLVSSSLVAIVVFRNTLSYEDLPRVLQGLPGVKQRGAIQEAWVFTIVMIVLAGGLAGPLWLFNSQGWFVAIYNWMHA